MGKTQSGAVWLDPNKTSPAEFYQYWRNVDDADVFKCLRLLTFLPIDQINELEKQTEVKTDSAKQLLAYELTALVHGEEEASRAAGSGYILDNNSVFTGMKDNKNTNKSVEDENNKVETAVLGAVIGDVIGSTYEFLAIKSKDFDLFPRGSEFTDDTIMTVAVGDALMKGYSDGGDLYNLFTEQMRLYGKRYPDPYGAYGFRFAAWLESSDPEPINSCGNGAAMRVSPCGLIARSLEEALDLARQSAEVSHDHPEGIKGAQATAAAVFLAKSGASKEEIKTYICNNFYVLDKTLDEIRPDYRFNGSCQRSVPESIQAFLESTDFEDAIRNVISLGGDADTMGAITGSIAWAYYGRDGITDKMRELWEEARQYIPGELVERVLAFEAFCRKNKS